MYSSLQPSQKPPEDLVASATEHYGYDEAEAKEYLNYAGNQVTNNREAIMADEIVRFRGTFAFCIFN